MCQACAERLSLPITKTISGIISTEEYARSVLRRRLLGTTYCFLAFNIIEMNLRGSQEERMTFKAEKGAGLFCLGHCFTLND